MQQRLEQILLLSHRPPLLGTEMFGSTLVLFNTIVAITNKYYAFDYNMTLALYLHGAARY